jgi:hypothetical protein
MKLVLPIILILCGCTKFTQDQVAPVVSITSPENNAVFQSGANVPIGFQLRDNRRFKSILFQCTDSAGNVIWHPKPGFPFNGSTLNFHDSFTNTVTASTTCKMRLLVKDKKGNKTDTFISFTLLH